MGFEEETTLPPMLVHMKQGNFMKYLKGQLKYY